MNKTSINPKSSVVIEEIHDDEEEKHSSPADKTDKKEENDLEPKQVIWEWPSVKVDICESLVTVEQLQYVVNLTIEKSQNFYYTFYHGEELTYIVHGIAPDGQKKILCIGKKKMCAAAPTTSTCICMQATRSFFKIRWSKPKDNGSPITGYSLYMTTCASYTRYNELDALEYICIADHVKASFIQTPQIEPGKYYGFYVIATNKIGSTKGPYSCFRAQSTIPASPSFLPATECTDTSITLSWTPLTLEETTGLPVDTYILQMNDGTNGFWNVYADKNTTAIVPRLLPLHDYIFRLAAKTSEGQSAYGPQITITTKQCACPPPNLIQSLTITPYSLNLYWSVYKEFQSFADSYELEYSSHSSQPVILSLTNPSVTITNLIPATRYIIRVRIHSPAGWGSYSSSFTFVTLSTVPDAPCVLNSPPDNTRATTVSSTSIELFWKDQENHGEPITDYIIEGCQVCRHESTDKCTDEGYKCTECNLFEHKEYYSYEEPNKPTLTLQPGMSCYYIHDDTTEECVIHGIENTIYKILIEGQLSFLYVEGAQLKPFGGNPYGTIRSLLKNIPSKDPLQSPTINIIHSACSSRDYTKKAGSHYIPLPLLKRKDCSQGTNGILSFTISQLLPNTSYLFRMRSVNSRGSSSYSYFSPFCTSPSLPPAPPVPVLLSSTSHSLTFSLSLPSSYLYRGASIVSYILEVDSHWNGLYDISISSSSPTLTMDNLHNGCSYRCRSLLLTNQGYTPYSNIQCFSTSPSTPDAPISIHRIPLEQYINPLTNYHLSWIAPINDGGSPILGYILQLNTPSQGQKTFTTVYKGFDTNYLLFSLSPGITYRARVQAYNAIGTSISSSVFSFSTSSSIPSTPAIPSLTKHTTSSSIYIQWIEPDNNGQIIDSYELCVNPGNKIIFIPSSQVTYTINKLRPKTEYKVTLRAHNDKGYSEWSDALCVMTDEQSVLVPYMNSAPTVTVDPNDNDSMKVTWKEADGRGADVLLYELYMRSTGSIPECIYQGIDKEVTVSKDKDIYEYEFMIPPEVIEVRKPKKQKKRSDVYVDTDAAKRAGALTTKKNKWKYYMNAVKKYTIYISLLLLILFICWLMLTDPHQKRRF
ncbi:hypothetical protein WA158_004831 [Blastocystis sp. Blastoise]